MKRLLANAILVASSISLSSQALALGLGELTLQSALNQPLKAEIELVDAKGLSEFDIKSALASQADFDRAGVDRAYFLTKISFKVENNRIVLTSREAVNEPYLNFLIELNWPQGRILREYTVLLDPPVFEEQNYEPVVAAPVAAESVGDFSEEAAVAPEQETADALPATETPEASKPAPSNHWDEPAAPGNYKVQQNDTLWAIALQTRPARDITPQQMMLALQQENAQAFIGGNINRLKSHYVLRIPDAEKIRAINAAAAVAEVARQNQAIKSSAPAQAAQIDATNRAAAQAEVSTEAAGGEVRLLADKNNSHSAAGASGSVAEGNGNRQALENDLAIALENVDKNQRENQELHGKLESLEEQISTLQRLISLKDDQLASLQAGSAQATPATAEANTQAPAAVEAEGAPATDAVAPVAEEAAAKARAEAEAKEQARRAQLAALMAEPEPAPEPELLDQLLADPMIPAGVLVVILLAAVLIVRSVKKRKDNKLNKDVKSANLTVLNDIDTQSSLDDFDFHEGDIQASFDEELDVEAPVLDEHVETQAHEAEKTADPLSEADFCIAFGKFEQALDLLRAAIAQEPKRSDLRLKLLEVYVEMDNAKGFAEAETALQGLGDAQANRTATQLRQRLSAPIAIKTAAAAAPVVAAAPVSAPAPVESPEVDLTADFDEGMDFEAALDLDSYAAPAAQAESADSSMDFDLGDFEIESTEPEVAVEIEEPAPASEDALEFDMSAFSRSEPAPATPASGAEKSALGDLEFDLGDDLESVDFTESKAQQVEAEALDSLEDLLDSSEAGSDELPDLDFDLTEAETPAPAADDDLSFDLNAVEAEPAPAPQAVAVEDSSAPVGDIDLDQLAQADDDFDMLAGTDECSTKLDLARAYIDMEDIEGARELLQEVMQEGSAEQQAEARGLISNL